MNIIHKKSMQRTAEPRIPLWHENQTDKCAKITRIMPCSQFVIVFSES
ncbi:Uncharacterised protein [Vibrio cholerae]|nr:Uncharacterised protein [Vibrio cholerae]